MACTPLKMSGRFPQRTTGMGPEEGNSAGPDMVTVRMDWREKRSVYNNASPAKGE